MSSTDPQNLADRAAALFDRFVAEAERSPDAPLEFAPLLAMHPDLAPILRSMHQVWLRGKDGGTAESSSHSSHPEQSIEALLAGRESASNNIGIDDRLSESDWGESGTPLRRLLDRGAAGDREWGRHRLVKVVAAAAETVARVAGHGIYRDRLSVDDIRVGEFDSVSVGAWGDSSSDASHSGEVIRGIGGLLFRALAGMQSWAELPSAGGLSIRPIASIAQETPPELAAICDRALEEPTPYSSLQALASDLRRCLARGEGIAAPRGAFDELGDWSRRHRSVAFGLGVVGVAIFFIFGNVIQSMQRSHEVALAKEEQERVALIDTHRQAQMGVIESQRAESLKLAADRTSTEAAQRVAAADEAMREAREAAQASDAIAAAAERRRVVAQEASARALIAQEKLTAQLAKTTKANQALEKNVAALRGEISAAQRLFAEEADARLKADQRAETAVTAADAAKRSEEKARAEAAAATTRMNDAIASRDAAVSATTRAREESKAVRADAAKSISIASRERDDALARTVDATESARIAAERLEVLREEAGRLKGRIETLEQRGEELAALLGKAEVRADEATRRAQEAEKRARAAQDDASSSRREAAALRTEGETARKAAEASRQAAALAETRSSQLEQAAEASRQAAATANARSSELEKGTAVAVAEKAAALETLVGLRSELEALRGTAARGKADLETVRNARSDLEVQLGHARTRIVELSDLESELRRRLLDEERGGRALREQVTLGESVSAALREQLEQANRDAMKSQRQISQQQEELSDLASQRDRLTEATTELYAAISKTQTREAELNDELEQAQRELNAMSTELSDRDGMIGDLNRRLNEETTRLRQLMDELERSVAGLRGDVETANQQIDALKIERDDALKQLRDATPSREPVKAGGGEGETPAPKPLSQGIWF